MSADAQAGQPENVMKISEAIEIYRRHGQTVSLDDRFLMRAFRQHGWTPGLSNTSYLHALSLTDAMFGATQKKLRMYTGLGADGFIATLWESFKTMATRIRHSRGRSERNAESTVSESDIPQCGVRILIAADADEMSQRQRMFLDELRSEFADVVQVRTRRPTPAFEREKGHFIVADSDMVRVEEPHPDISMDTDASIIKATVYFCNEALARTKSSEFDALWNRVST